MILILTKTKICTKCKCELDLSFFGKDNHRKDKLFVWCKTCCRQYYEDTKDRKKEYAKEYRKNNKEKIKSYRDLNKEKQKEYMKEYVACNKEKRKDYLEKNKEEFIEYRKEYNKTHKEEREAHKTSFVKYDNFSYKLTVEESPTSDKGGWLLVKCTYCGKCFYPTYRQVESRIRALNGKQPGESRLYCSEKCKKLCPIYHFNSRIQLQPGSKKWIERQGAESGRDPILQIEWRAMVLERDGFKCTNCGSTENLEAHHKEGIQWNPLESADIDMGITLCEKCHKNTHSKEMCSYLDMQCK